MNHNFTETFLKASFSIDGISISKEDALNLSREVRELISNELKDPSIVYLQDDNPLRFCLTFFTLLDFGHAPIALAPDFNQVQKDHFLLNKKRSWLENGSFIKIAINGKSEIEFENSYACLTSGTTGSPKVCWLSTDGARFNASAHAKSLKLSKDHTLLQSLPLYHSFGIACYLWTVLELGCQLDFNTVFLGMKGLTKRVDAKTLKNAVLYASPAQLKFMLREKVAKPVTGVDIISFGGGEVLSADVIKLEDKFEDIKSFVTYGLTEAGPRVSTGPIDKERESGFIGCAFKEISVKVLTDADELKSSGLGKLCIKSPSLKQNQDEDETRDGYYITRDLVQITDDEIFFQSREHDLIKVGGVSIYAKDIEVVAREFEGLKDCLVFSKEHKMYGEIPILIAEGEVDKTELLIFLKDKLAVLQIPKKIHIVSEFPRHSLDKINRKKLFEIIEESS
ncbi:hypothetical protein A9Q84_19070 [Halobacteriovorax marinus]|uniref:AMP-dependent synthetase/ligase domain-containing protein n=1 Tax=Halobacteriovorax marinus TaxID=97084 RepID=A0A1Y5F2B9_9BACT|nr:hypothetical protein A9Q84_19070 [Halobacteriovorax marinus]